ncbi:MAG: DNA polymerase III subunit epsilon [Deltaproteobacteria bacterium]|nr:MAG: DNA polymerase III subunit epsilon [Deltaproteobacteria bacterium]
MSSKYLYEVDFAFLDVETTGLDPYSGDRICEIAVLKIRNGKILDKFETLVNPGRDIPPHAVSINGITDNMVENAPFFREIAWDVFGFLRNTVIVAHNAPFDLGFLFAEFDSIKLSPPEYDEVIDTLSIAKRYYSFPSNSLGRIARYLGIPTFGEHRAFGDVRITKDVFEYFIMDLRRKGFRIERLKDIVRLQGGAVSFERSKELVLPPAIEEALRIRGKLKIKYLSAYGDVTTTRIIEPLGLSVNGKNTYIIAFCHLRKEKCTFRLDRILEVKNVS